MSVLKRKRAGGFDMILPKLVKMLVSALCQPLSNTINNSLLNGIFPGDANIP